MLKMLFAISLAGVAFTIGLLAPDADLKIGFLHHRSALTHEPWLALLTGFLALRINKGSFIMPLLGAALCVALTIHLAADLFPSHWAGFALIHMPMYGRVPAAGSVLWLVMSTGVSATTALYLGWRCLPKQD